MPRTLLRSAIAVIVLALLAGAPSSVAARTYTNDGDGNLVVKPKRWWGGSGVGGGVWRAKGMRWTRWGSRSATGRGIVVVNTCDPMCASGNMEEHRATFRLRRPRRGCRIWDGAASRRVSARLFTRVDIRFPAASGGLWRTAPQEGFQC